MPMGFEEKGVQWYIDEAVRAEEEFHRVQAEAARVAPDDDGSIATIVAKGRQLVLRLAALEREIEAEVSGMWAFHDQQASRPAAGLFNLFISPGSKEQYRHQFVMAELDYQEVRTAMELEREGWDSWLSAMSTSTLSASGHVVCGAGHENHPTRTTCLLCGLSLAASPVPSDAISSGPLA